jgi:chromosome segregation ATPase|mmetsp:Transcript_87481/g.138158  ORF Transcript_87481/g.138158 Transcript_87481/m.138158 type:complete len:458 (+) Transcript_87481:73-1446(+)
MSLRTPSEWHQHSDTLMSNASSTQDEASRQSQKSKKTHQETINENMAMYQDLHGNLENKVITSHRLIDKLGARAASVSQNIEATQASLTQLELALHEKKVPMTLVSRRMEERQKRPLREHVRDQVEVALEEERDALADSQRKLSSAIVMTKNMVSLLKEKLEELRVDIDSKMQALSVDELCLRTTHRSWVATADCRTSSSRASTGARSSSALAAAAAESNRNEIRRQRSTRNHDQHARRHEEASAELRSDNQLLVQRCSKAAKDARAKTEKCLQARVAEVRQMRKRLEIELRETEKKVDHTKTTINETQSSIHRIQEPIALCSSHTSWRKHRADKEQIMDPVDNQLEHQKQKLMRATEELHTHKQSEKTVLTALGEQVERLREDLRDKIAALNIDVACLEHINDSTSWNGKAPSSAQVSTLKSARRNHSRATPISKSGMVEPLSALPCIITGSLSAR